MAEDPQLIVRIGADATGVEAGMDAGTEAVQAGADDMAAAFAKATAAASALTDKLAALSAANIATADTAKAAAKSFSGGGFGGPQYMATYGAAAAAGMNRFGFVLARLGSMSQIVFPALIASLGAIAAVHLGSMFESWAENTYYFAGAIKATEAANASMKVSVEGLQAKLIAEDAQWAKINGHLKTYLSLMDKAGQMQTSVVETGYKGKGGQAALDQLHSAGLAGRTLVNQLQQHLPLYQLHQQMLPAVEAAQKHNAAKIAALQAELKRSQLPQSLKQVHAMLAATAGYATISGNSTGASLLHAEITAAEKLQVHLGRAADKIKVLWKLHQQAIKNLTGSTDAEAAKHDHTNNAAARRKSEYDYERTHANVLSAHSGYFSYFAKYSAEEKKLTKANDELATSEAKLNTALSTDFATGFGAKMKAADKEMEANSKRASEAVLKSWEALQKKQAQSAKAIQTEQKKIAQGLFGGFNEGLKESIKGVMMGTESINMAWRRMMGNMLLSTITNWAEILMQHAEGWAAMEILKAAGIATSERMDQVHAAKSAATDSHLSASHAFEKAMGSYPPPLNVPIAIAAAAAAAAANMSIAGFATGGIVPNTGIALVHQGEAVLPRPLTDHLMASTGKGGPTNITVHALDGADATNVLTRNRGAVASSLHRQLRSANLVQ